MDNVRNLLLLPRGCSPEIPVVQAITAETSRSIMCMKLLYRVMVTGRSQLADHRMIPGYTFMEVPDVVGR